MAAPSAVEKAAAPTLRSVGGCCGSHGASSGRKPPIGVPAVIGAFWGAPLLTRGPPAHPQPMAGHEDRRDWRCHSRGRCCVHVVVGSCCRGPSMRPGRQSRSQRRKARSSLLANSLAQPRTWTLVSPYAHRGSASTTSPKSTTAARGHVALDLSCARRCDHLQVDRVDLVVAAHDRPEGAPPQDVAGEGPVEEFGVRRVDGRATTAHRYQWMMDNRDGPGGARRSAPPGVHQW